MSGALERLLIVPDAHHPYVDPVAWGVFLAGAKAFRPNRIVVLGDFIDCYCVSRHRKDPTEDTRLEVEIEAGNAALDQLDALGAKHKHFIAGNHEARLSAYLAEQAPALFNMIKVERLFRLKERGWSYTPYGKHLRVGKVFYSHDPAGCGAYAHMRASKKYGHPIVFGHTHRAALAYEGDATGAKRIAMMAGWLGDLEKATYVHEINKVHEWMHSFAIGYMEPSGVTHLQLIPIVNGRACIEGKIVTAKETRYARVA